MDTDCYSGKIGEIGMTPDRIVRWVRFSHVAWFMNLGWEALPIREFCYHHRFAIMMELPDHGLIGL